MPPICSYLAADTFTFCFGFFYFYLSGVTNYVCQFLFFYWLPDKSDISICIFSVLDFNSICFCCLFIAYCIGHCVQDKIGLLFTAKKSRNC